MNYPELLQYAATAIPVTFASIGVGIGQGIAGASSNRYSTVQKSAGQPIFRTSLIGLAVVEGVGIIALITTILSS